MADLAAIQAEIMPRLERLLALAALWAEPARPFADAAGRTEPVAAAPAPVAAAGPPAVTAAGRARAGGAGEDAAWDIPYAHGSALMPREG